MSSLSRDIIAIDMLKQELVEQAAMHAIDTSDGVSEEYLRLIQQCVGRCRQFAVAIEALSEFDFSNLVATAKLEHPIASKQLFAIYIRLLEFVDEYYQARHKVVHIQANEFDDQADRRLDLLQTRAIKARSQYKTVAKALGEDEYLNFIEQHGLPQDVWSWTQLRLD